MTETLPESLPKFPPRTPEEYDRIISTMAKLLLDYMEHTRTLVLLLTPEGRQMLAKIGSLPEKPLTIPPEMYR